ncbi:Hypoxanthine-guanine phosphoribosyltransferase [Polystyrenella longa]|uniref:Hypoxanthine phosphoribosyltransferase n=1 Tax=Polystyrenella longa TaxID=2528007 RepID=A0A518CRQ0_9PLAN|nr:hypoxanthine phosphoribosyltransferase [Polystyrenella longa]QDU81907.1 Hypoxanthine-guanine phosphoribosyltransferase [Polystyrenella longa]
MKKLIEAAEIEQSVKKLGREIEKWYQGEPLTILGVLTGSVILLSDLVRAVELPIKIGLIQASSYRGASTTRGELIINESLIPNIDNRHVLLLDDIFDTGHTLQKLIPVIEKRKALTVRTAVLLWKQERTEVDFAPDYHCFKIPNEFVVGYGLDYNDEYRHLPFIASLEPDEIED